MLWHLAAPFIRALLRGRVDARVIGESTVRVEVEVVETGYDAAEFCFGAVCVRPSEQFS